ncbi:cbb3-type cytochrome oxidase assembly protein CcoS [Novosphingobium umbonatum]|uniref:Cbb3-type cytochrome oxidase assembly protein CcoS n=1 Tax=Novosphingobium umbonatum TaxID=1908524 RepID=A0A437NCW6_9SPHN|nr:cbb3-type cytochrome oxidase assembly protein CcoS [Novosphingobium umbonatum]RVU07791.1 cbb3-type cytochrome oxidase assembly protein CcoS [Novosphingobium umbonatum]
MTGLAFLIPVALLMGLAGLFAFFWSLKNGQYEDMDGAAARILIEDDEPLPPVLAKPAGDGAQG